MLLGALGQLYDGDRLHDAVLFDVGGEVVQGLRAVFAGDGAAWLVGIVLYLVDGYATGIFESQRVIGFEA